MKYDYGQELLLSTTDASGDALLRGCVVVGITPIENPEQSLHFDHPIGTVVYTVEFGDGSDALVPEQLLQPSVG